MVPYCTRLDWRYDHTTDDPPFFPFVFGIVYSNWKTGHMCFNIWSLLTFTLCDVLVQAPDNLKML